MKTGKAFYVGISRYSFRRDEPAEIVSVVTCYLDMLKPAVICFKVIYADGFVDYCLISETKNYNVLTEEEVTVRFSKKE